MLGSATLYSGVLLALAGAGLLVRPCRRLRVGTRRRALDVVAAGLLLAVAGLFAPTFESNVSQPVTRLDQFAPAWQFREFHDISVAVPPARAFDAIKQVRADEIFLFHALTWIRRGGAQLQPSILNPGNREPLIDVAVRTGFVRLVEDAPHELVIGTLVVTPSGGRVPLGPEQWPGARLPSGSALATMNFLVKSDGLNKSLVSTETRVYANSPGARRVFAAYWRAIYPGSAIIRRMWLRAIQKRATSVGADVYSAP